jgi:purine-binding chemotaxis protein CheW
MVERKESKEQIQLVIFKLGSEEFGVGIGQVHEIIKMQPITRMPNVPHFIEGVINLRGTVMPVIDLKKRFSLSLTEYTEDTSIMVVEVSGKKVGMIVDKVSEVLQLLTENIEPTPSLIASEIDSAFIKGVGKLNERLLILLDIEKILSPKEKAQLIKEIDNTDEEIN